MPKSFSFLNIFRANICRGVIFSLKLHGFTQIFPVNLKINDLYIINDPNEQSNRTRI